MGESPDKIKITGARTRWGSCSSRRVICFSWRLMMAPPEAVDYVVVHELAHLRHMDHSASFWQAVAQVLPDYEIRTFQAGGLEEEDYERLVGKGHLLSDVDTVLTDYDGDSVDSFFSYLDNGVLQLPVYMDSRVMEDEDDFRSRCLQTAYGYYGTAVDTSKVIYPESDDDSWNIISNDWSKNYRPYRTPFEAFEKTTATEADRRVRNYLALEYEAQIGEDRIEITADSPDGASYYVVRIHGKEIGEVTGGTCEEIEKGWYLVTVEDESVQITLEQTNHADYYIE